MFSFSHPHLFQVTQHAVIKNSEGAILIVKDESGAWNIPGDRIRVGETWRESLARALKEKAKLIHFEVKGILEVDSRDEHGETFYDVVFAVALSEFEMLVINKEKIPHAWVSLPKLDGFPLEAGLKQKIFRWLANIPPPNK